VAALLGEKFMHLATNKGVADDNISTDVDVSFVDGDTLYLCECKHSLAAASIHEQRDLWQDIEKGVSQLETAVKLLQDDTKLRSRLGSWFPKLRPIPEIRTFMPFIVTSFRMFSGLSNKGVAVRDIFSLENLLHRGFVELSVFTETKCMIDKYFYWAGEVFSVCDLNDYLKTSGRYYSIRQGLHREATIFDLSLGNIRLARKSYIAFQPESREEQEAILHRLGCTRKICEEMERMHEVTAEDLINRNFPTIKTSN
jgi:hypothetical protein